MNPQILCFLLLLTCPRIPAQRIEPAKLDWLKTYAGKSTNSAIWDRRFHPLMEAAVPKVHLYLGMSSTKNPLLIDAAEEVLFGPPNDVTISEDRYVILSACRPHSCPERGFLWADTAEGIVIGALVHFFFRDEKWSGEKGMVLVYSRQVNAGALPARFQQDLDAWIARMAIEGQQEIKQRRFVNASGVVSDLSTVHG